MLSVLCVCFFLVCVMQFSGSLAAHQELNPAHGVERMPNVKHWATWNFHPFLVFAYLYNEYMCFKTVKQYTKKKVRETY